MTDTSPQALPPADVISSPKRPVTVLSGFLGSGKTTLLNHLLNNPDGLRIAVMINDFGDVNIDRDLVVSQGDNMIELSGGCLCCSIREDLLSTTQELLKSGRPFDCIVVETSGLADPSVVAKTFLVPEIEQQLRLDAILTVVDGANIATWLDKNEIAAEQIRYADLLIVNKLDLLDDAAVETVKTTLQSLNADARILTSMYGVLERSLLLDVDIHRPLPPNGLFTGLGRGGAQTADADGGQSLAGVLDRRHSRIVSASLDQEGELDYDRFDRFIQSLPDGIYRAKGTVAIAGLRRRVIFHRVGGRNVLDQGAPWAEGEARFCRAVFLGEGYDREQVLADFATCAPAEEAVH